MPAAWNADADADAARQTLHVTGSGRLLEPDRRGSARRAGPGRPVEAGLGVGSAEYRDLVAQDEELDVLGRRRAAEQHQPAEDPIEDQIEEAERHVRDHVWPLRNADHRTSQAQADFWNPTGPIQPGWAGWAELPA